MSMKNPTYFGVCYCSVIQFCATAFGYYAQATAAQEIFGHTLQSLRGIKYLYKYNVFQIGFIVLAGLTFVYYAAFALDQPCHRRQKLQFLHHLSKRFVGCEEFPEY